MEGPPWSRWLIAALLVMIAAVPISRTLIRFSGLERSIWVEVVAGAGSGKPPDLRLAYGEEPDAALPVAWEELAPATILGVNATAPVKLAGIDTDRGGVPPWLAQAWGTDWRRSDNPPALHVNGPGVFDIQGTFRRFTLTFEPGPARVDVGWLDQRATVDLSRAGAPVAVTLTATADHRGWVLLPPLSIDRLAIRSTSRVPFVLTTVTVHGPSPQAWSPLPGCAAIADGAGCEVPLPGLRALNRVTTPVVLAIWTLLVALGLVILWIVARVGAAVRRGWDSRVRIVDGAAGAWLHQRTRGWTLRRVMLVTLAVTLAYHLSYALTVPLYHSFDSLGYYAFGRNLRYAGTLSVVATCRTPGYPAVIAASVLLFGDVMLPLAVVQHLAIAALGCVVVWFLFPRVGPLWSAAGGLLAGTSPIMSLLANVVWTETLFMVSATAALLVFIEGLRVRSLLAVAGLLAGVATLIRPNGVVLIALMGMWLFAAWWCDPSRGVNLRRLVLPIAIVIVPFVLVTAVWLVHFHRVVGHWGVSDANCAQEGQVHPTLARGLRPTDIFQLAGFVNLISQNDDIDRLAIARPHGVFFRFFPARHRYFVERFLPWDLTYDDRFTGELFREYLRFFPGTYARQVGDALLFNLAHTDRAGSTIFRYPDLEDVLTQQMARPPASPQTTAPPTLPRTITWTDADALLTRMTNRPTRSARIGALHLRVNRGAMALWALVSALALLGTIVCAIVPGLRSHLVLAAHALILSAAPAVLAMGADRYAMVAEPAFYVLAVVFLSHAVGRRVARHPDRHGVAVSGSS